MKLPSIAGCIQTWLLLLLLCRTDACLAQDLQLPPRATNAPDGDLFIQNVAALDLAQRDWAVTSEFLAGNVPNFLRKFCPVSITNVIEGVTHTATVFVAPDYLAIGSDQNYFLAPVSPGAAQLLADRVHCLLPTRKLVDAIYAAAEVQLPPVPIPPSPAMTTVPVFARHNEIIRAQRMALAGPHPLGALVAGHKKDVVISPRLAGVTNKVAIYGWRQTNGVPIQPLYLGHVSSWVDYSQCVRLISQTMLVDGMKTSVAQVLADPKLNPLLSDEGAVANPRYPPISVPAIPIEKINQPWPELFFPSAFFGEWSREIRLSEDARIVINAPPPQSFAADKPVSLIFYALPNGNSIEQTIGRKLQAGDDWHFGIQNIGAQTRWLRQVLTNQTLVVAYLEAGPRSWPAWRKQHDDGQISGIFDGVRGIFSAFQTDAALASHSGGGSLIFGYLNSVQEIPGAVRRIAFLDSDYGYDSGLHDRKIQRWLQSSGGHHLCVLAYQDYLALLNGKTFVSENGGTWGRSLAWLKDLSAAFKCACQTNGARQTYSALQGRVQFTLMADPERKILHTVQVERNGFIQAMLSGTSDEGRGYEYFGEPVYTNWIQGAP